MTRVKSFIFERENFVLNSLIKFEWPRANTTEVPWCVGATPVITAVLKSCYVMANQFPRAGFEPAIPADQNSHALPTLPLDVIRQQIQQQNRLIL